MNKMSPMFLLVASSGGAKWRRDNVSASMAKERRVGDGNDESDQLIAHPLPELQPLLAILSELSRTTQGPEPVACHPFRALKDNPRARTGCWNNVYIALHCPWLGKCQTGCWNNMYLVQATGLFLFKEDAHNVCTAIMSLLLLSSTVETCAGEISLHWQWKVGKPNLLCFGSETSTT
mmetsp:Transcript_22987/g.50098  ORF Transcript_22987/g.50098 Transcript_22987/m.50098 type:complete len:177 (+) Transcript_22987:3346-3876(+)